MVRPIYELTSVIDIKIVPSHQEGEEWGKPGGAAEIFLLAMSLHN